MGDTGERGHDFGIYLGLAHESALVAHDVVHGKGVGRTAHFEGDKVPYEAVVERDTARPVLGFDDGAGDAELLGRLPPPEVLTFAQSPKSLYRADGGGYGTCEQLLGAVTEPNAGTLWHTLHHTTGLGADATVGLTITAGGLQAVVLGSGIVGYLLKGIEIYVSCFG